MFFINQIDSINCIAKLTDVKPMKITMEVKTIFQKVDQL